MKHTRRNFLKYGFCGALGAATLSSTIFDLRKIAAATAETQTASTEDYKALVCLFMNGGNDGDNTIVARGNGYAAYAQQRGNLALPQNQLLPINPMTSDGREWAFHPSFIEMQNLFETGKLAILGNVGNLVVPTTKAQFQAGNVPLPPSLFSHNDQQVHWQTSLPDQPPTTGWGGRTADLLRSINGNAPISMCISIAGANTFEVGNQVAQYHVSTEGSIGVNWYDDNPNTTDFRSQAINQINALDNNNLFENEFRDIKTRSITNNRILRQALESTQNITTVFPNTHLGRQLKMIARLVSARNNLGLKRQIFFCQIEGFDTHGEQLNSHSNTLRGLSQALAAFYNATVELNVANNVTTFTASDFGRTYASNGQGSDHGWGGHQFIMGGDVRGKKIYGRMPIQTLDGPDDSRFGRWIPTTSVDEYSATLARWFGVSGGDLPVILPNIGRFSNSNLGFMV